MTDQVPRINEIVALLNKHAASSLNELQKRYPDEKLLKVGEIAGRTDRQTRVRAEAAVEGLKAAIAVCEALLPKIRNQLKQGNKLQLTSQLVGVIGGASVFSLLALDYPRAGKYAAASLTLIGALTSVIAQYFSKSFNGAEGGLFDLYRGAVECNLKARELLAEIEPWVRTNFAGPSRAGVITTANEICFRIIRIESEFV